MHSESSGNAASRSHPPQETPSIWLSAESPFTISRATDGFLSLVGLNRDQVVGHALQDVFPAAAFGHLREGIEHTRESGSTLNLPDLECIEPEILFDAEISPAHEVDGAAVQLRLIETARTELSFQKLIASLFRPVCEETPSMLYLGDVRTNTVRALRNNLTPTVGLGNCFTVPEFQAVSHPEDVQRDDAYLATSFRMSDDDFITFDQRIRTATGEWHQVAARSRVLTREADGSPSRTLGIVFDVSQFHIVNDALTKANAALSRAEKAERAHLGRDLHDSLSQTLVAAKLIAQSLERDRLPSPSASEKVKELGALVSSALEEIRDLSFLLHPPDLDALGLVEAVRRLCKGLSWRFGIPIVVWAEADLPAQRDEVEFALFRVVQEALMNVHRHSGASRASVAIRMADGILELEIQDDGSGLAAVQAKGGGVGLSGMRARLLEIGGRLDLEESEPGLRVHATVPVPVARTM